MPFNYCELYWLWIKNQEGESLNGHSREPDSRFLKQYSINTWDESAGFTENNHKPPRILIGKWIDACVVINNSSWKCLPWWEADMSESRVFWWHSTDLGVQTEQREQHMNPITSGTHLVPMCNVLHISGNQATLKPVICWWDFIPVVHGFVFCDFSIVRKVFCFFLKGADKKWLRGAEKSTDFQLK